MFHFIQHRKIFYAISGFLAALSIVSIFVFGLNLGIDFTGGSVFELTYQEEPPVGQVIRQALADLDLAEISLQKQGEKGIVLKTKHLPEETRQLVSGALASLGEVVEGSESFQIIGPSIGQELKGKTKVVIVLALLAILIYIALSFRRVSRPVRSLVFGVSSVIALFHDVLITLGVLIILGKLYGVEIDIPIITAFLTVFGYSINDSVVIFDRVRENLSKMGAPSFDLIVEQSLNQSMRRSLHTSLTTLLALFAIFFLGGASLKFFALALIIGIMAGTYSSLFLATPLLATYLKFKERKYRR